MMIELHSLTNILDYLKIYIAITDTDITVF